MKLRLALVGSLVLTACPADDAPEGEEGTSSDSMSVTTSTSSTTASSTSNSTASSTSSDPSTSATTSEPTTSTTAEPETSTGEEECAEDRLPAAVTEIEGCAEPVGEPFCSEGAAHVKDGTTIVWQSNPPHSGPHYPMWQTWGEHPETVPRGNWVHNLEHGGIVLTYLCPSECPEELDVLRQVIAERPDLRILMTSDPELGQEGFAAISWTWIHRFDTPDLATLLCFADQHEGNAPEDVP